MSDDSHDSYRHEFIMAGIGICVRLSWMLITEAFKAAKQKIISRRKRNSKDAFPQNK